MRDQVRRSSQPDSSTVHGVAGQACCKSLARGTARRTCSGAAAPTSASCRPVAGNRCESATAALGAFTRVDLAFPFSGSQQLADGYSCW